MGRRRSWGSVTTVTRNKQVIRWVEDTPEGRKRKSKTIHGTYREACTELDRIHVAVGDEPPCPTVGKAAQMWWLPWLDRREAEGRLSARTRRSYESVWRVHVEPRWGGVPLDSVKPAEVQDWLLGLPPTAAQRAIVILRRIESLAVKYEAARGGKFSIVYDMPISKPAQSREVPTVAEAVELMRRCRGTEMEAPVILMAWGGLRPAEALGVRADELELQQLDAPCVHVPVARQMEDVGDHVREDRAAKNPQSERIAVVAGKPALRLMELADARQSPWLCERGDGLPLSVNGFCWRFREKLGMGYPPKNLRAAWRTYAELDWRVDADVLELLMGHSLPGVTGKHYLRPNVDQLAAIYAAAYAKWASTWEK